MGLGDLMRKYLQLEGVGDSISRIHMLKKIVKEADNIVTDLHNIDASWIVSGTIAWARLAANFPKTIATLLSDHNLAHHGLGIIVPHDALASLTERAHGSLTGIGADNHHARYTDAEAQAQAAALIIIHAAIAAAHHARYTDAEAQAVANALIAIHAALATGVHGVGADYIAKAAGSQYIAPNRNGDDNLGSSWRRAVNNAEILIAGGLHVGAGIIMGGKDSPSYPGEVLLMVPNAAASGLIFPLVISGRTDTPEVYPEDDNLIALGLAAKRFKIIHTLKVADLTAPINDNDAARKKYVDDMVGGYTEGARVYHNVSQSIPDDTLTALTFNSERYDTDTIHSTVTNPSRLTCKTAGKYLINFHGYWANNAVGIRIGRFMLNGVTIANFYGDAANDPAGYTFLPTIYDLAVNDYVEIKVYQTSGAALDFLRGFNASPEFMMQRIG